MEWWLAAGWDRLLIVLGLMEKFIKAAESDGAFVFFLLQSCFQCCASRINFSNLFSEIIGFNRLEDKFRR